MRRLIGSSMQLCVYKKETKAVAARVERRERLPWEWIAGRHARHPSRTFSQPLNGSKRLTLHKEYAAQNFNHITALIHIVYPLKKVQSTLVF